MRNGLEISRRSIVGAIAVGALPLSISMARAAQTSIKIWKDPRCGCCGKWIEHLARNGFAPTVIETGDVAAIKSRLGVPVELQSCHTAEVEGFAIEGHVPAVAIRKLLSEKPRAGGLAVPGMPIGSPGMEGGRPEVYEVVLFGRDKPQSYGRYLGDRPA